MDPFGNDSNDLKELAINKYSLNRFTLFQRLAAFFIILAIWIILVIVIIVKVYIPDSEKEDEESEKHGEINCIFEIKNTSINYPLLGEEFDDNNVDIIINDKVISKKNYKFEKTGKNEVKYILYGKKLSMDYMFKDVPNLINVEMMSDKDMSITSMISSFENCINLKSFKIEGFLGNSLKSTKKLFYNSHINNINLTNFEINNVEDISYTNLLLIKF